MRALIGFIWLLLSGRLFSDEKKKNNRDKKQYAKKAEE